MLPNKNNALATDTTPLAGQMSVEDYGGAAGKRTPPPQGKQEMWTAVDMVIDYAEENGIKYRRGDFAIYGSVTEHREDEAKNLVCYTNEGVYVCLFFDFARTRAKLHKKKGNFAAYDGVTVKQDGIYFKFELARIEAEIARLEKRREEEEKKSLINFSEDIKRVESHGYSADWIRNGLKKIKEGYDPQSDATAFFLPKGEMKNRNGSHKAYGSPCPYYEGYWLTTPIGYVKCSAHEELILGCQWYNHCAEHHEHCPVYCLMNKKVGE